MKISHNILPKQKPKKQGKKVNIDLYDLATELYEELDRIGIIQRTRDVPQLGIVKVKEKLKKSRFDYMMLQLYLHGLTKKELQPYLRFSYNTEVKLEVNQKDSISSHEKIELTMCDVIQLLTIVYNIGHFYKTFTSSRAVIMMAKEDASFADSIINACSDKRYQDAAKSILHLKNYKRLHLLNSILILEQCDKSKKSVGIALEILYAYINERELSNDDKLKYVFQVFKKVRTVSYISYDLQIADTPLTIDLCDDKAMKVLLKELLAQYNDKQPSSHLVNSITKLLDDTVYNENSNAICYYNISRKMVSLMKENYKHKEISYYEMFIDKNSILNQDYPLRKDYLQHHILKLTFSCEERECSEKLLDDLERINNTRVGYYDRYTGQQTILVSLRKSINEEEKIYAAFKTLKCIVNSLRKMPNVSDYDSRYLLTVKFFLFYLFDEYPLLITPTINKEKCVICTRGKNTRIQEIKSLLRVSEGNEDQNHEVEFLLSQLLDDSKSDTTITIPASIVVYHKEQLGITLCEFDGMIIHPQRKENQVIFLEAKNKVKRPSKAKKALVEKFEKLNIAYKKDDIKIVGYDAYYKFSILSNHRKKLSTGCIES